MNGLEAIKFMENGKMVVMRNPYIGDVVFKITDGTVYCKNLNSDFPFEVDKGFDFSKEYEEYIKPKTLTGWERVEGGKVFKTVSSTMIISSCEVGGDVDIELFESANYFSMLEKAEEIKFKQTLFRKLQRFSDENCGDEIDWNDGHKRKYYICFNHRDEELIVIDCFYAQGVGQIHFVSKEVAKKAIELFHDDLIQYFTYDWSKSDE